VLWTVFGRQEGLLCAKTPEEELEWDKKRDRRKNGDGGLKSEGGEVLGKERRRGGGEE